MNNHLIVDICRFPICIGFGHKAESTKLRQKMADENLSHEFVRLLVADESWNEFEQNWRLQCEAHGEEFDQFATASLPVILEQATNPTKGVGVFGLRREDGQFDSVVQATSAFIPGYQEKVLRVRHLLMSPNFDFGEYEATEYSKVLVRTFVRACNLAKSVELASRHIKFHLRSPAERDFFALLVEPLEGKANVIEVAIKGAWLHLTFEE